MRVDYKLWIETVTVEEILENAATVDEALAAFYREVEIPEPNDLCGACILEELATNINEGFERLADLLEPGQ